MSNLTHEQIQNIRLRLDKFLKDNPKLSQRKVGDNTGYSSTTINQFLNDSYPTEKTLPEIASKIQQYLDDQETIDASVVSKGNLKFALTTASKTIFKVADYAKSIGKIGVITGLPGIGKTITCKEYVRRNPTSILIEVSPLVTKRSLVRDIAAALKITTVIYQQEKVVNVPTEELFRSIVEQLRGTTRLLIIDEGENLTGQCLEVVRRIQDFTEIGILLAGTSKLLDRLRGTRKELQQLFSRVAIQQEIKILQLDDVRGILQINYPDAVKHASIFLSLSKQNGRYLQHLISLVKKTIQETDEPLSEQLIDDAASSLLT